MLDLDGAPIPSSVHFRGSFLPTKAAKDIVSDGGRGAFPTLVREFSHKGLPMSRPASKEACKRAAFDRNRFPETNYEKEALLWKGEEWRVLEPEERACLLYTSPSPRDQRGTRMPSSA